VPEARTAAASFFLTSRRWAQVGQELLGQYPPGRPGRAARLDLLEDAGGLASGDALAGDQVAEYRACLLIFN